MSAVCFCGCGRAVARFPLGRRSINKRGTLVAERLDYASALLASDISGDDRRSEGLELLRSEVSKEGWETNGLGLLREIRDAVHGDADDLRALDPDDSARWLAYGREIETVLIALGLPSINAWLSGDGQAAAGVRTKRLLGDDEEGLSDDEENDDEIAQWLFEEAVDADSWELSEQIERQLHAGSMFIVGVDTFDSWTEDERDRASLSCRLGFMLRLTELSSLPGASEFDPEGSLGILNVIIRFLELDSDGQRSESAQPLIVEGQIAAAASAFTASREMIEAILYLTPGASSAVRERVLDRWDVVAADPRLPLMSTEDHRRLVVYGFALAVVVEFVGRVHEEK
jgi:hypothetical protein